MSMYPLLFPFDDAARCRSYLKHALQFNDEAMAVSAALLHKNLLPLITGIELAYYLGVSRALISHICHCPEDYYNTFQIRKKSGGSRQITAPRVFLKTIQRYITHCVFIPLPVNACAHGFEVGRSVNTGASVHLGMRFVWNIDVKEFFPSISKQRVKQLLLNAGYPEKAAWTVASLCSLDGKLPQGAPSSPVISNRIFKEIDDSICIICDEHEIKYTRYADDLSFSSLVPIPVPFRSVILEIISRNNFGINGAKTRLIGPKQRREITGLVINNKVSIPRYKRRLHRSKFHSVSLAPQEFINEKHSLLGYASWIYANHPDEGRRYLEIARAIPDPINPETA